MNAVEPLTPRPRRRGPTLVLVASALALGAAGLAATPPAAADASGPVAGGQLDWGVKASFRSYILGPIANGSITPADSATDNGDGTYRFPATGGSHDHTSGDTTSAHGGSLRFVGHGGALDLTLSDLRIEITGTAGVVRADVASKNQGTGVIDTFADIEIATLDLAAVTPTATAGGWSWTGVPATLTAEGSNAFGGFYPAGADMDPLAFALDLGAQQPTTTTTTAPTSTTTSPTMPTTLTTTPSPTASPASAVAATPSFAG